MALSGAPTTGSRAAAPGGPRPKDWALTVWAHQGPVDAGAVTGYAERARAPSHSEQSPRSPAMPTALPRLPQASRPKVPVPCQSAGGQPYQSLQSRRTTSAGASTREALELGRPQRQEEMGTQRPSCTRWPGGQRQPGGGAGRTSKIRCSDRCARWIPPDGVQSLRLAPSARPPVPRVTWSPHRPQGRSSSPCVAQPRGNPQGCPRVTCPRGAGGREAGPGSPRAPRPGCRPSLATWAAGSLQTLHTVPEVDTASRTPVGTAEGEHGVPGLAALP